MHTSYRGISGMHTFVSGRPLITIPQSIPRVLLVQFGESSRELLHTLVFDKLAYYDVIIPGREAKIHCQVPIDVAKPQTKSLVDSVSVTIFFYKICNIQSYIRPFMVHLHDLGHLG